VGATQDLAALDIDLAAITQAGGWKSTQIGLDPVPSSGHRTSKGIEHSSDHRLWRHVWVEDLVQPFDYPPQIV
jgi:hypothetical protein